MSLTTAKAAFIDELLEAFEFESQQKTDPTSSRRRLAQKLANAIDKFVREGEVKTVGTATAQTGKMT